LQMRGRVGPWVGMAIAIGVFIYMLLRILSALIDVLVQVRERNKRPYFMSTSMQSSKLTFRLEIMMKGKDLWGPHGSQKVELSLTIIDNSGLSSLEQSFENKMKNGKNTIEDRCPGIRLSDITYGNDCSQAVYDLGCWAIAYLLNKEGQTALLDTFYPSLNELGWEGAFQKTFGMSSEHFYAEFDAFFETPLADQLAILPKYD